MPKFKKFKCDILSNFQTLCLDDKRQAMISDNVGHLTVSMISISIQDWEQKSQATDGLIWGVKEDLTLMTIKRIRGWCNKTTNF